MKVEFKDSFFESVEKLVWYDSNLWKVWAAIRYDIPLFFKNVWRFRKELYNHQWWDYRFHLEIAELELGKINHSEFEFEETEDGNYRLIDNDTEEDKKHARKVYKRARVIEEKEWKELWDIFKGKKFTTWEKYDGSDLRGWWD
jgi:hypothetical protein